jgi:hypothetical protein
MSGSEKKLTITLSIEQVETLLQGVGDALTSYLEVQNSTPMAGVAIAIRKAYLELQAVDADLRGQTGCL